MRLTITTPLDRVVMEEGVISLVGEDASGSFGIQPGHADFLTSLTIGVLSWTGGDGARRHCAVRRGVLTVRGGTAIAVATREAVASDDLAALEGEVLARFRAAADAERVEHAEGARLQLAAIRQIVKRLHADRPRNRGMGT